MNSETGIVDIAIIIMVIIILNEKIEVHKM